MPKLGMEPKRRAALVSAVIDEIGEAGSLDVTVSKIAKRAGMSSGLAHHYFGSKDQMLIAAMRHILKVFSQRVVKGLAEAQGRAAGLRPSSEPTLKIMSSTSGKPPLGSASTRCRYPMWMPHI